MFKQSYSFFMLLLLFPQHFNRSIVRPFSNVQSSWKKKSRDDLFSQKMVTNRKEKKWLLIDWFIPSWRQEHLQHIFFWGDGGEILVILIHDWHSSHWQRVKQVNIIYWIIPNPQWDGQQMPLHTGYSILSNSYKWFHHFFS